MFNMKIIQERANYIIILIKLLLAIVGKLVWLLINFLHKFGIKITIATLRSISRTLVIIYTH